MFFLALDSAGSGRIWKLDSRQADIDDDDGEDTDGGSVDNDDNNDDDVEGRERSSNRGT